MHQRLNLQVQAAMEELEEEQEPLGIKHGSKHCMYLCIEREEERNQTATLSLERGLTLKRERASVVGQLSASPSLEHEPMLKREEDNVPPSFALCNIPKFRHWNILILC